MVRRARFVLAAAALLVLYFVSKNVHIEVQKTIPAGAARHAIRKPPLSDADAKRLKRMPKPDIPDDPHGEHEEHAVVQAAPVHREQPAAARGVPKKEPHHMHHGSEPHDGTARWLKDYEHFTKVDMSAPSTVTFYADRLCKGDAMTLKVADMTETCPDADHNGCMNLCNAKFNDGPTLKTAYKSVKVTGRRELDLFEDCGGGRYWGSVLELDECTNIYDWPPTSFIGFTTTSELDISRETKKPTAGQFEYRIVYSAESSTYFSYQAQSSYWGFMKSNQEGGGWIRLITSSIMDDLAATFPTWAARRHPYSRRYGPINKGDVLAKWFASVDAPTERVLVVVDPDNWMTKSIRPWVDRVQKGHALGQEAWYAGARSTIDRVWKKFCLKNCDFHLDLSAVPYFVHRDDLEIISPLWKYYSLKIKEWLEAEPAAERQFGGLQIGWCAEMYGYNFAAAHAGVVHEILPRLQLRDVGPHVSQAVWDSIPMIHIGRIWWPKAHGCKNFCHTEGRGLSGGRGDQVWCKCNITAKDVIPWPKPPGMDHVSETTLDYLHDSREFFGDIPDSPDRPGGYHNAHP